jgi:hypothetical protein
MSNIIKVSLLIVATTITAGYYESSESSESFPVYEGIDTSKISEKTIASEEYILATCMDIELDRRNKKYYTRFSANDFVYIKSGLVEINFTLVRYVGETRDRQSWDEPLYCSFYTDNTIMSSKYLDELEKFNLTKKNKAISLKSLKSPMPLN